MLQNTGTATSYTGETMNAQKNIVSTFKTTCPVCGSNIIDAKTVKGGRPRTYCSDECKRFENLASWLEEVIPNLPKGPDTESKVRQRLWYLANLTNTKRLNGGSK